MPKLRIALVTETYTPEINGVAMTLARWVEGLTALGHEVELWRPQPADTQHPYINGMVTEHRVTGFAIPMYPELRIGQPASGRLASTWRERRPHVVYIATEGPLGWSALRAARRVGIPIVSGFHTRFDAYSQHYHLGLLTPLVRGYLRRFHQATTLTLAPTPQLRDHLTQDGFGRIAVIPRGVNTHLFHPARRNRTLRKQWGLGENDLALMSVGRIAKEKNLSQILHSVRAAQHKRPGSRLILVGDGPLRSQLAREHPDIVFAGTQRGTQLAEHYASADIFLFASRTETFGNVTLEAMASGLPVVAYDYAAAALHIRNGESGLCLPLHSTAAQFDQAVLNLVDNAELRQTLGYNARHYAEKIDWERVVLDLEALLIECARTSLQ